MEDLALRYLDPEGYYELVSRIAKKRQEREGELEEIMKTLAERLDEVKIEAQIQGRPKHFYSIYQKMKGQGRDSPRSTTLSLCASSSTPSKIVTACLVWSIRFGSPSRAVSRITLRCPNRTCTSRCIRR